jgi:hypothetical protein
MMRKELRGRLSFEEHRAVSMRSSPTPSISYVPRWKSPEHNSKWSTPPSTFSTAKATTYIRQVPHLYFHVAASMQDSTGEIFSDSYSAYSRSLSELPAETSLINESPAVADSLSARRRGHAPKRYNGPVLFEGESAAELFAHHFADLLSAHAHSTTGSHTLFGN